MMTRHKLLIVIFLIFLAVYLSFALTSNAKDDQPSPRKFLKVSTMANIPNTQEVAHKVGELYLTVTNWGFFGSQRGLDNPRTCYTDDETGKCLPSAEYPGGSGIEYLFQGALWIGTVVDGDTLVSLGNDGWFADKNQFFPGAGNGSAIKELSINPNEEEDIFSSAEIDGRTFTAVSEQDFIAIFTDTLKELNYVSPEHLTSGIQGIKVTQQSHAWSYSYCDNFIFIDYELENMKEQTLHDVYIGIYIDGDVGHVETPNYAQDDINGYKELFIDPISGDTTKINTAWLADNDGDPVDGVFTDHSPTGALGAIVLNPPTYLPSTIRSDIDYSFNWWISHNDEQYDWGPYLVKNDEGWDGTPEDLKKKYQVMSNGEFDIGQYEILNYFEDSTDWVWDDLDEDLAENLQNGFDTRFLFSFGPLKLDPGQKDTITIAFFVAENFHVNPLNTGDDLDFNQYSFNNLAKTAKWCIDVYDNPGVDTDPSDGKSYQFKLTSTGDTIFFGDGVADYQGPTPPPPPDFEFETYDNKVILKWSNDAENARDPITAIKDLEGYKVYVSETKLSADFRLLKSWDRVDYKAVDSDEQWVDEVHLITQPDPEYYGTVIDTIITTSETVYDRYEINDSVIPLEKFGYNTGLPPKDSDGYYYYEIDNLRAGKTLYFSVTAFDYGMLSKGLESLESSVKNNAKLIIPRGDIAIEEPYVVPNPYRMNVDYNAMDEWEAGTGPYDRLLRFMNLPEKCVIRIYTLDGDLVQLLYHDGGIAEDWDLISRNNQSVVSGIYIFTVEDTEDGTITVGKFVII